MNENMNEKPTDFLLVPFNTVYDIANGITYE